MQLGRKLSWDPATESFASDAEANSMLSRPRREPWTIGDVDSWIQQI